MSELVIFEDDRQPVAVQLEGETVWLTQRQMSELFGKDVRTINEHVGNVYSEGELEREPTIRKFRIVRQEGSRQVQRQVEHYNLDVIISVGYRVKSQRGVRFRQWATRVLRDHLTQGYSLNEHRLAQQGLTALTLLIAESDPKAKDLMVRLTMNLLSSHSPAPRPQPEQP